MLLISSCSGKVSLLTFVGDVSVVLNQVDVLRNYGGTGLRFGKVLNSQNKAFHDSISGVAKRKKKSTRKELNDIIRLERDSEVEDLLNSFSVDEMETRIEAIRKEAKPTLDFAVRVGCRYNSSMRFLLSYSANWIT